MNAGVDSPAPVTLRVNGGVHALPAEACTGDALLVDALRDGLGLKGTRLGCGAGECGACQVLLDGRPVAACTTPLWACVGHELTTVEALPAPLGDALRAAFVAEQAAQCGYCSSGLLVAATALLQRQPQPTDAEVRSALDGHLCRCGAHNRIVRAVLRAAAGLALR